MKNISIIAAMSENRVIGLNNTMPWHIPEELQHFKQLTMGKPMIMGRKTFDAIGRRVLPGRKTIVLTRDQDLCFPDLEVTVVRSIPEALESAADATEIMVVGGANIYKEFLPLAQRIYLSVIPKHYAGDAFFPKLEPNVWHLSSQQQYEKFLIQYFDRQK